MDTVAAIFRVLFLFLASLTTIGYILFQFFQRLPAKSFQLATGDYIVYFILSLVFGFALNSYYGLLAFLPLLAVKFICRKLIVSPKRQGSGMWIEVDWRKLMPKGFGRDVPKMILDEMNKMPKDTHFIIPRLYMVIALKFIRRRFDKEMKKGMPKGAAGGMGAGFSKAQQDMAMGQFTGLLDQVEKLQTGQMEKKDFPFGVLKVKRF